MNNQLYNFENLATLFINKKGEIMGNSMLNYVLAGAILSDLILKQKIEITVKKKRHYIKIIDLTEESNLFNSVLEESLSVINSNKSKKLSTIISKIANIKKLKNKIFDNLEKKEVILKQSSSFLFFFTKYNYTVTNTQLIFDLKNRVVQQLQFGEKLSEEFKFYIAFINSIGLIKQVLEIKLDKTLKKQIKTITEENIIAKEVKQVIDGIRTAIITAIIIPIITSTTR